MVRSRWSVFLVPAVSLVACNPANGLEGSIGETLSLEFDTVAFTLQDAFLLIEYQRRSARANEKVCKLVIDIAGLRVPGSGKVVLEGDEFMARVELQRATLDDDQFPAKRSGELTFDQLKLSAGGTVAGEFAITFENEGSLSGWFAGELGSS